MANIKILIAPWIDKAEQREMIFTSRRRENSL
jgi:hypothetical protein